MRSGDVVYHRPTGETWVVAAVDGLRVYPAGWPETLAWAGDVELREECSDEEHRSFAEAVARTTGPRGAVARRHECEVCARVDGRLVEVEP